MDTFNPVRLHTSSRGAKRILLIQGGQPFQAMHYGTPTRPPSVQSPTSEEVARFCGDIASFNSQQLLAMIRTGHSINSAREFEINTGKNLFDLCNMISTKIEQEKRVVSAEAYSQGCFYEKEVTKAKINAIYSIMTQATSCIQAIHEQQSTQPHSSGGTTSAAHETVRFFLQPKPRATPSSARAAIRLIAHMLSHCLGPSGHSSRDRGTTYPDAASSSNSRSVMRALRRFHTSQNCLVWP